jgi:hypothetical protein
MILAASWTATPRTSPGTSFTSPVCTPARVWMPIALAAMQIAAAVALDDEVGWRISDHYPLWVNFSVRD